MNEQVNKLLWSVLDARQQMPALARPRHMSLDGRVVQNVALTLQQNVRADLENGLDSVLLGAGDMHQAQRQSCQGSGLHAGIRIPHKWQQQIIHLPRQAPASMLLDLAILCC